MNKSKALALLLSVSAASALADSVSAAPAPRSIAVAYADLDLGTQRGITILNQRVRRAAARLCDRRSVRPLGDYLAQQDCVAGTMQTARPQIEQALAVDRHARLAARQQRPADTN